MTPKKVATELANKFVTKSVFDMTDDELKQERLTAKNNALICVDEILRYINRINETHQGSILNDADWLKVRDELNGL
jgi:hypothetical protein